MTTVGIELLSDPDKSEQEWVGQVKRLRVRESAKGERKNAVVISARWAGRDLNGLYPLA